MAPAMSPPRTARPERETEDRDVNGGGKGDGVTGDAAAHLSEAEHAADRGRWRGGLQGGRDLRRQPRRADADGGPEQAAEYSRDDRFADDLADHEALAPSDGLERSELADALGDRRQGEQRRDAERGDQNHDGDDAGRVGSPDSMRRPTIPRSDRTVGRRW